MFSNIIQRSSSRLFGNIRVKGSVGDGIEKMMRLQYRGEQLRLLNDLRFPDKNGLLRTGIVSLLLHVLLVVFFVFSLKATHTKGEPSIYRVTLRTFTPQSNFSPNAAHLPVPAKTQIQKEEDKRKQLIKQREPVFEKKNLDPDIHSSIQAVTTKIPPKEQKQPPDHQEEEEAPILLPIGVVLSPLNTDLSIKTEDNLPTPLSLSRHEEHYQNVIRGSGFGEGSGQRGSEDGSGPRQGGFGWGGSGDGSGTGRGGPGGAGSGNYGTGMPHPRYAENPKPIYPLEAREKGYKGEVLLRVEVLSNGQVGQIELKKSSGYEILDQSALSTVKKWRFIPGRKGGIAIPVWVNIPIKFELL